MNHSPAGMTTAQTSVTTTATLLASKNSAVTEVMVINEGTTAVHLGASSAVTSSNGALLPGAVGATITLTYSGDLYGITASGSQTVSVIQLTR